MFHLQKRKKYDLILLDQMTNDLNNMARNN